MSKCTASYHTSVNTVPSTCAATLKKSMATMDTHQLGPENPRPFAVLSEGHIQHKVTLPYIPDHERFSFGPDYEKKMCELVDQYLELNTDDQLCYVGDAKGSFVPIFQQNFCLLKPVVTVVAGHMHYEESPNHKLLPFKVKNVGAEEFFITEALLPAQFEKILIMDTVQYFDDQKTAYTNMFKTIKEFGKLLIIHRAAPMCTLPFFSDAKERMIQYDQSYLSIIQDLQSCGMEVQWEVESLPVRMHKHKWMAMLREKFPIQMDMVSDTEVTLGLRELSEGVMKYPDDLVEFPDRLLFITAQKPFFNPQRPRVARFASKKYMPVSPVKGEILSYEMNIAGDIKKLVIDKERALQEKQKKRLVKLT